MKSPTLPCTLLPEIGHVKHGLPGSSSVPGYIPLNQKLMFKAMFSKNYLVEEETSGSGTASSGASSSSLLSSTEAVHSFSEWGFEVGK